MSAPYWNLRDKVQEAFAAFLVANSAGALVRAEDWPGSPTLVPVRVGYTADLVEDLPMVAVIAEKSSRYLPEVSSQADNTRAVTVRVVVKTSTDEQSGNSGDTSPEDYHAELVAKVYDMLNDMGIVAALNAVAPADCTVQAVDLGDESSDTDGNVLASSHELTVVAMPQ
jgi:hypothetical protein